MVLTLQISCNPYTKRITYKDVSREHYEELDVYNPLLKYDGSEFRYIVTDIVEKVYEQGYERIIFEGSDNDYEELEYAVKTVLLLEERFKGRKKLECIRLITNARDAFSTIKKEIEKLNKSILIEIPIVIMGTYGSGKTAFINALIGTEVLPSTRTAKIHRIRKSAFATVGKISFRYDGEGVVINFKDGDVHIDNKSEFCKNLYTSITENSKDNTIENYIYQTLKQLNEQDIKDICNGKKSHFSDLIEVEIPSEKGIFSDKKVIFSVFDTPGFDFVDKDACRNHFAILEQILRNQTQVVPVFVTVSNSMNVETKEFFSEVKNINLDKNNWIVIANKAELFSDEDIEKLLVENEKFRDWQSACIYFVSSIGGLASQKGTEVFYNDDYEQFFKKKEEDYLDPDSLYCRQLYGFNIIPNFREYNIKEKCQKAIESGDEKKQLLINSGIQCVVDEVLSRGEKYAVYNEHVNAKNYLAKIKNIMQREIEIKKTELEKINENKTDKKNEEIVKLKSFIDKNARYFGCKVIIQQYEKEINYIDDFNRQWLEYKKLLKKYSTGFGAKQRVDQNAVKEILEKLLECKKNTVKSFDDMSRIFFKDKERFFKEELITRVMMGKSIWDLTNTEKEKVNNAINDVIEDFSGLEKIRKDTVEKEDSDIMSGCLGKDNERINFRKLGDNSKKKFTQMVQEETQRIQMEFEKWFATWYDGLLGRIEREMVFLVPSLIRLKKKQDELQSSLDCFKEIVTVIEDSEKKLDGIIGFQK